MELNMGIFRGIARRLAQPSSMAGVAALAALAGAGSGQAEAVAQIVGGLAALLAVVIDEGGMGGQA